jgi:phage-related tail fiber protein
VFGDLVFINPPATETVKGVAEIATQTEVNAGTDDTRFVTAKKLKNWVKAASGSVAGLVKLSSSTASSSTSVAATSSAVKAANDNANTRAPSSRTVTAGNGLTGGGSLGANRTLALGAPAQITDSSTNSVGSSNHSHAIDHASTSQRGIVRLSTSTASSSTSYAATPSAVKAANDNANTRLKTSDYKAATESTAGKAEIATQTETNAGTDNSRIVTPKKLKNYVSTVLTGSVSAFAMSSAPSGWLKCNGAAVSRTSYAALYAKIGTTFGAGNGSSTFNLPDLRSEFIRGYDDGRGVDVGRTFGSKQKGTVRSFDAGGTLAVVGERGDGSSAATVRTLLGLDAGNLSDYTGAKWAAIGGTGIGDIANTTEAGWGVTRPRNVALNLCIKY